MKINKLYTFILVCFLSCPVFFTSCEDYLDKAPEVDMTENDVFRKFITYQAFMEDIHQCVVNCMNNNSNFSDGGNWGDELVGGNPYWLTSFDDNCDYWIWYHRESSPFNAVKGTGLDPGSNMGNGSGTTNRGYWNTGWEGIRKCNIALKHLDDLKEPYKITDIEEQRRLLEGQALFFRAYFHYEILRAWGGIPYIDFFMEASDEMKYPRLSYWETADKVAEDFQRAAELLPADWDDTATGQLTLGNNTGRVSKGAAYALLGKNYLYAASPLMNGVETGDYSAYNTDYCKKAIAAFNEVIKLAEQDDVYQLIPFERYSDNFFNYGNATWCWTEEHIFNSPKDGPNAWQTGGWSLNAYGNYDHYRSPTANYAEYFGMESGLPITEGDSGYNPSDPWKNRDPRFYTNYYVDGDFMTDDQNAIEAEDDTLRLYIGGKHRGGSNSVTGYHWHKFCPIERIKYKNGLHGSNDIYSTTAAKIRLADVYLMYAEAANEAYGPAAKPAEGMLTAEQAVNRVRARVITSEGKPLPGVAARFLTDTKTFREQLYKERAVELAFEGHRWYDLRRWYVAHLSQYTEKYALEFDKEHTYFQKKLYLKKPFEMRHYWLPFTYEQVSVYEGFYQNPGW